MKEREVEIDFSNERNLYQIYRYTFDRWLAGGGMSAHIKQEELMTSHG